VRYVIDAARRSQAIPLAGRGAGPEQVVLRRQDRQVLKRAALPGDDQSRQWKGQRLGDMPRRRERLPQQFDSVTNRTIELIDVLWLNGNSIEAAFEVESTTSIYSGLLRMSDLLARQPNISVPLFLVAPEDRRDEVIRQVNRPTFATMNPPLVDVCRYISFEGLRDALTEAEEYVSHLKPTWLQTISESCAPDEDL
jgi:hypothetical protein